MNHWTRLLLKAFLIATIATSSLAGEPVEIAFSPNGGATELVVKTIESAKSSIRVAAYSFASKPIAEALLAAHRRGADVKVVVDKSNATDRYTAATFWLIRACR